MHKLIKLFIQQGTILFLQFAFPYPNHGPYSTLEKLSNLPVMFNITSSLILPILVIISWTRISAVMTVPEAPVDKYGDFFIVKNKIGMTFNLVVASPPRYMVILKEADQFDLGAFITGGFDPFHYLRSFLFCENVSQLPPSPIACSSPKNNIQQGVERPF